MDLGAYAQIDDLSNVMKDNGIEVPRLRGLRLMKDEEPLTKEDAAERIKYIAVFSCRRLGDNYRYMIKDKDGYATDINWKAVHGKKRKTFRFEMKKAKKKVLAQYEMFNKYCGREDVLYIHARIGGNNWNWYDGPELAKQPWFIEKVDDSFDSTYCDIYARINEISCK